jgi:hypothetical protein
MRPDTLALVALVVVGLAFLLALWLTARKH